MNNNMGTLAYLYEEEPEPEDLLENINEYAVEYSDDDNDAIVYRKRCDCGNDLFVAYYVPRKYTTFGTCTKCGRVQILHSG